MPVLPSWGPACFLSGDLFLAGGEVEELPGVGRGGLMGTEVKELVAESALFLTPPWLWLAVPVGKSAANENEVAGSKE